MPEPSPKVSATAEARNINELDETRWERIAANFRTIAGAVLLAFVLRTCLFEAFEIEGPSMEPTLLNGDRVVVSKFAYGLFLPLRDHAEINWGKPNVGDVVILKSPADGVDIIKRVIGVGGDLIEMRADRVYRNGQALPATEVETCSTGTGAMQSDCRVYESKIGERTFHISTAHISPDPFPMRVPEGHVYVLGDHRDHSNDSRNPMVGAVNINRIKGRALAIYWSSAPEGFRWNRMFSSIH
ncbi:MAG TPA: signal peptidase I [Polyangiales bacterium]|nr:signal peptidase I [Polyangiales bacterium]